MSINKVIYGTTVLVDLTSDTITPDKVFAGATAHDSSGASITGTAEVTVEGEKLIMPVGLISVK